MCLTIFVEMKVSDSKDHLYNVQVVLDEEVSGEQAEAFRKQVARLRHPASAVMHFALAPRPAPPPQLHATKHHTLKYTHPPLTYTRTQTQLKK